MENAKELGVNLKSNRLQKKLFRRKLLYARNLYGSNNSFNFGLFDQCCREVIHKRRLAEKKLEKKQKKSKNFEKKSKLDNIMDSLTWKTNLGVIFIF